VPIRGDVRLGVRVSCASRCRARRSRRFLVGPRARG